MNCKVCGSDTDVFAVVDISKHCHSHINPLPEVGEPVEYRRCEQCGFIGTRHFDAWTAAEWRERIYNDEYGRSVDPEYAQSRPRLVAGYVDTQFHEHRHSLRILDYGSGNGACAETLRLLGYMADGWDPMDGGPHPSRGYDLVLAVEVFEHMTDPLAGLWRMLRCLDGGGLLIMSTLLAPDDVDRDWWYMAPRNGHVSLHTRRSLAVLVDGFHRLQVHSNADGSVHFFWNGDKPWFAPEAP